MWSVTVRYGIDTTTKSFDSAQTIGQLKANDSLRAGLGYGDNVNFVQNGVTLADTAIVASGSTVAVETRCNTKAAA